MKILMLVATSVATDTRVLREARALVDDGHQVHIIGKAVPNSFVVDGITVSSATASSPFASTGGRQLSLIERIARWLLLPTHRNRSFASWRAAAIADARQRTFDVIHAHDFTALEAAVTLSRQTGAPYVYDAHEFWSGRPREYRPTPLQDRREKRQEQRWGRDAAAVITVGEEIADELRGEFGWDHVHVVFNAFPQGQMSQPVPRALAYTGRIAADRELGVLIEAASDLGVPAVIAGPADEAWLTRHRAALKSSGIDVRPALGLEQVTTLLHDSGIALVSHSRKWRNHELAMPNKLFHAVHAGVPVVATDASALASAVRRWNLGAVYRAGDSADMVRAVREVLAHYDTYRDAVRAAGPALSWEHSADVLRGVYRSLAASL